MIFKFILALLNAVPKLKELWDEALVLYIKNEIKKMREKDIQAIRKAVFEHDQRDLEKQLFGDSSGKTSGIPGTEFRPDLPNVLSNPKKG